MTDFGIALLIFVGVFGMWLTRAPEEVEVWQWVVALSSSFGFGLAAYFTIRLIGGA